MLGQTMGSDEIRLFFKITQPFASFPKSSLYICIRCLNCCLVNRKGNEVIQRSLLIDLKWIA